MKVLKSTQENWRELQGERLRQKNLRQQDAMAKREGDLVKIPLTQGRWTTIDRDDYPLIRAHKWFAYKDCKTYYSKTLCWRTKKILSMHRIIMGDKTGHIVDHIDRNGLNNSRSNLRFVTPVQSSINRSLMKNNKSGFRGVFYDLKRNSFKVMLRVRRVQIYLGNFKDPKEAALAYDKAAKEFHGEFAQLNFSGDA